jgi:hypothetical protein
MMSKLKLTVNDSKTRVCVLPEEKFDFLGYTFGQCHSPKTGRAYGLAYPLSNDEIIRHLLELNSERADGHVRVLSSDLPPKKSPGVERLPMERACTFLRRLRSHIASTSFRRIRHCDPNSFAGSSFRSRGLRTVVLESRAHRCFDICLRGISGQLADKC